MPLVATAPNSSATAAAPGSSNVRWIVCGLLFLATTINYMDRSVLSLIEPLLHAVPFMGWDPTRDATHQTIFNNHYGNIVICFQIAYGFGLLTAGRIIDRLGTKVGYALAILVWGMASMGHSVVSSVAGFCIARALLGIGESGNFPAAIKAVTEWFPAKERALATGIFNSGSNASAFIAPALVVFVTLRYGWQAAFLTTGSLGLVWLALWLLFPYNRLRLANAGTIVPTPGTPKAVRSSQDLSGGVEGLQERLPVASQPASLGTLLRSRGLYAFSLAKGLTDPIWWFYLFYLPKYLNENYGLDLKHAYWEIVAVYAVSSVGSIAGGGLSGWRMQRGHSVDSGRKFALLLCALGVLPIMLVPAMHTAFPATAWPAVALFALAAAAHQGWSANLFSTPTDMFPSTAISTVVGIGGAAGAAGGAVFTAIVKTYFSLHPLLIFVLAGFAYVTALLIFQLLVPRLGDRSETA